MRNLSILCLLLLFSSCFATQEVSSQRDGYVDITQFFPKNHSRKGDVDYTELLQKLLNRYNNVLLPNFPIMVNDQGVNIKSNKNIKFQEKSAIVLKPTNKGTYSIFRIRNSSNITIYDAKIDGNRPNHLGNSGEFGIGIYIMGSSNVRIIGGEITNCWGDGISIVKASSNISRNLTVQGVTFRKNRRNGVTIGGGERINVHKCKFYDMDGTLPMAAIDIEPNDSNNILRAINITNIESYRCNTAVQIGLNKMIGKAKNNVSILIQGVKSNEDNYGLVIGGYYPKVASYRISGVIRIEDVSILGHRKDVFETGSKFDSGPTYRFKNISFNGMPLLQNNKLRRFINNHPNLSVY